MEAGKEGIRFGLLSLWTIRALGCMNTAGPWLGQRWCFASWLDTGVSESLPPPLDAEGLARHYSRFRVGDRVLLTGHSHQAWPDVAFEAQQQAWLDAAEFVDDKWDRAFGVADEVRSGFRQLLDDPDGHVALGQNTHELVTRFLSALPLRERPRLVTTDGEFGTIRRQLARLQEEGVEIATVGADAGVGERLADAVDDRTAAVLVSSVLFRDATIVQGLDRVADACAHVGAELLVDAYHSLAAVPFSVRRMGLDGAFVVGGGYKYCQLGEGNCFLRLPAGCTLRPVLTGWFAEFGTLADAPASGGSPASDSPRPWQPARYAAGHRRFAGATYDPASHYRAAAVFGFFREHGLTPMRLRASGLAQIRRLAARVDALDLDPAVLSRDRAIPLERKGGFLALETPFAGEFACALRGRGVYVDHRGTLLRLGPAPYVVDAQLNEATTALGEVAARFNKAKSTGARAPRP